MSIQWMAVTTFFYVEILALLLLCSPLISPQKWHKIFSSRLVYWVVGRGRFFFGVLLLTLALLFLYAMWETRKFESLGKEDLQSCAPGQEHQRKQLFQAQRNMHVTGFALLLSLLLRRLATLQKQQALLQASREALQRQAEGADEAAQRYRDQGERLLEEAEAQASLRVAAEVSEKQALQADLRKLTEELEACRRNLGSARDEAQDLRKRCEGLAQEQDRQRAGQMEACPDDPLMK